MQCVVEELRAEDSTVGVLLHGSFARGKQHADSDVDLLCVTDQDWFSKEIRRLNGFEIEVQKMPVTKVRSDFTQRLPTNNNFTLSIFVEGRVLFDRDGEMQRLVEEAHALWQKGPPRPGAFEIMLGRSFFRHRLTEVKRLAAGDDPQGIARVMMDLFFYNALYGYCKTHCKWALKFNHLLQSLETEDPDFYLLCTSYLGSSSDKQRVQWLEKIVDAVMKPVGWGSVEYQTPQVALNQTGQMRNGMIL